MIFDILFLIFIGVGFWQGYKNGIIYSIFSLLGYFLGIIAALKFSFILINLLHGYSNLSPKMLAILSFVLVFVFVVLIMKLIAWGLEQILKSFSLDVANKIGGGIIHSLVGLYVLCVFIWFVNRVDVFPQNQKKTSHVYPYIANLGPRVVEITGKAIPYFKDSFQRFDDLFNTHTAGNF